MTIIPRSAQLVAFAVLLAGTLWMARRLQDHGAPLKRDGGHLIRALELAPTAEAAHEIVADWEHRNLQPLAIEDVQFDYAFIALYSTTLAFAAFLGAVVLEGRPARFERDLAWSMWFAGACDVLENLGMTSELHGNVSVPQYVCVVSSIKWILLIAGVVNAAIVLPVVVVRWRRLVDARR